MSCGIIEGFFGPQYPSEARLSLASFLAAFPDSYYVYAPKQDAHLRRDWRAPWDAPYLEKLSQLSRHFRAHGVRFGVGFSPFGIGTELSAEDARILSEKLGQLQRVGIDLLGVFFDDMPVTENLAAAQIAVVDFIRTRFPQRIAFCPSFYCFDPILEKVFGKRPEHYFSEISALASDVELMWTGPKVISPEIPAAHLREVRTLLKRAPFLWENFFANDGPKNCKFLKLRPFTGRTELSGELVTSVGLNLMNQAEASKLMFLAAYKTLQGQPAEDAFERALDEFCTSQMGAFLRRRREAYLSLGLDQITPEQKASDLSELGHFSDPLAREIEAWLRGEYVVGSECLTD